MKSLNLILVFLLSVSLLVVSVACGDQPEAPPVPAPTSEPEPEPKPTPDSTTIDAELLGQTVSFDIGDNSAIWQDVETVSADGKITLKIPWGTTLADKEGNAITELSAAINENPKQPEFGRLLGPTVTFYPDSTYVDPALEIEFDISDYLDQLGEVPESDLYIAQYIVGNDDWGKGPLSEVDTENHTVRTYVERLYIDYTIGVMAKKKVEAEDAGVVPDNGVNVVIDFVSIIKAGQEAKLTIQTVPNAHVVTWFIMPDTGTRSTRPSDRVRQADADGKVTWEFTLSTRTHKGEGRFEFYATTSEDADFLAAFNAGRLDTIYPDLATDLKKIKAGEITMLEVDDKTTARWYPLIVAQGG